MSPEVVEGDCYLHDSILLCGIGGAKQHHLRKQRRQHRNNPLDVIDDKLEGVNADTSLVRTLFWCAKWLLEMVTAVEPSMTSMIPSAQFDMDTWSIQISLDPRTEMPSPSLCIR